MTKVNWKNHLREFIVVVFGILLAFQLDRCGSDSSQQQLIQEHFDYIKEETSFNLQNINYNIDNSEKNLILIDSLMTLTSNQGDNELINKLSFDILNVGYLYLRKNAYNSLVNSGDIRFIKSFDKKKKIINLYEYYSWTKSLDDACRTAYENDFFPYIKTHFDLVNGSLQDKDIYYSKTFINALATYRFSLDLKIKKFKDCKQEAEDFLDSFK